MKALFNSFICMLSFLLIVAFTTTSKPMDYYEYATSLDLIEIIDTSQLTTEALENRGDKLIIERVIGVVTNAETGMGYVIDNPDFYISYASVEGISDGDVICTYFIYNPGNSYIDDIVNRFDYIIDDK